MRNNPLLQDNEKTADLQTNLSQKFVAKWLHIIGIAEGTSLLLLLFIAMPLKYQGQNPILVQWLGPIHGGLFMLYLVCALGAAYLLKWRWFYVVLAFGASTVPFGPFIFEAWLRRTRMTEI